MRLRDGSLRPFSGKINNAVVSAQASFMMSISQESGSIRLVDKCWDLL